MSPTGRVPVDQAGKTFVYKEGWPDGWPEPDPDLIVKATAFLKTLPCWTWSQFFWLTSDEHIAEAAYWLAHQVTAMEIFAQADESVRTQVPPEPAEPPVGL